MSYRLRAPNFGYGVGVLYLHKAPSSGAPLRTCPALSMSGRAARKRICGGDDAASAPAAASSLAFAPMSGVHLQCTVNVGNSIGALMYRLADAPIPVHCVHSLAT